MSDYEVLENMIDDLLFDIDAPFYGRSKAYQVKADTQGAKVFKWKNNYYVIKNNAIYTRLNMLRSSYKRELKLHYSKIEV